MKIGLVAPVKPSHPYLKDDPAQPLDLHHLRISPWLWFSHIKPWALSDKTERLNPQNGLCLNALHDRAFDRGLISVTDDYSVMVSNQVTHSTSGVVQKLLLDYAGRRINLPSRFIPHPDFLEWHRDNIFVR